MSEPTHQLPETSVCVWLDSNKHSLYLAHPRESMVSTFNPEIVGFCANVSNKSEDIFSLLSMHYRLRAIRGAMNQWLRWCVLSRWARSPGALWVKNETSPNNRVVAYVLSACFVDLLLSSFRRRIVPRFCHFPPQAQIQAFAKLLLHHSHQ